MNIIDAIKKRRSIRRFSNAKPDWRKIIRAIDGARYAPCAGNNFVNKFILVSDKEKIEKISQACQQGFVSRVHYIVVVTSEGKKLERLYHERGKFFCLQQTGAAVENFLLALEEFGLATCWVGYYAEDLIRDILEIPDDVTVEAIFPIGLKRKGLKVEKKKIDLENIVFFDKWKNKTMTPKVKVSGEVI